MAKYRILKTHAKTKQVGLYIRGEVYEKKDIEDFDLKFDPEDKAFPVLVEEVKENKPAAKRKTK